MSELPEETMCKMCKNIADIKLQLDAVLEIVTEINTKKCDCKQEKNEIKDETKRND